MKCYRPRATLIRYCLSGAQLRNTNRQFAQCYLIFAHFRHSKFNTVCIYIYIYRIALLALETLHSLSVCMVAQLHALSAQQNKH